MLDQPVDLASAPHAAIRRAETLLSEGLPFDLTERAAVTYIERCLAVIEMLARVEGATKPAAAIDHRREIRALGIKLRSAHAIAVANVDADAAAKLASELRERAESVVGPAANAYALVAWGFAMPGPEHTDERVRTAYRVLEIAAEHGEDLLVPAAYNLLLVGLLEQGEIRALDIELLERRSIAASRHASVVVDPASWFHCLRSILDGDTVSAERQVEELFANAREGDVNALALYTTQIGMIRWMQGRVDGAEEGFLAARRAYPEQLIWAASLAWLWLLQGRRDAGETLLRSLPDPEDLRRDRYWLSTLVVLGEMALITGSRTRVLQLKEMLLPFSDHLVPVGVGVAFWGTVARTLALLEERLGMLDEARAHLELAINKSGQIGALAWHAEAQIELAEFAIRHELADVPAYELLAEARATSEARGFAGLARRAMHRPRVNVLGAFEVVSLCGTRAEWTSRKARELLKMLIAARGIATSREVYMDALWPDESPDRLGNRFSVAVNVIRRALDPNRLLPTQHHVVTEGDSIRLDTAHVDIDLERFLTLAKAPDEGSRRAAASIYRGDAFSDEPYADWAVTARDHAKHVREVLRG